MIDGAERGAGAQYYRQPPLFEYVNEPCLSIERHHQPAGAFDDERCRQDRK